MSAKANGDVQEDNDTTRVTHWSFAPGAETGFHRHEYDYVVVPLTSGALNIVDKDGTESTAQLAAGVEHNVINASGGAFAFVEIEFK